jgi:putative PIG3 family NAD(P)H quinone oxidoreductase
MPPREMDYVAFDQPGPPGVLHIARAPIPRPGPGELLIRVLAAGINRPDIFQRKGFYPPPPGANPGLGLEVAGVIADVGDDMPRESIGRRVCALTNGGGYAEYVTVPFGQCLRWPKGYDAVHAAALPETAFTVYHNLFTLGGIARNRRGLIHGGSSGIGTTAIQFAAAVGATVYATAGTEAKCEACRGLGAAAAINYRTQDFVAEIAKLTNNRGVHVILDMVGASYLDRNLASLAEDGRLVFISFLGGTTVEKLDLSVIQRRRLTLTGSALRPRSTEVKASIANGLRRVIWPLLDAGSIKPVIQATFPLREAVAAHRAMEQGEHIGKFVLTVAPDAELAT